MFEEGSKFSVIDLDQLYVPGIYRIAMKEFNGVYVGESHRILTRWRDHISHLDRDDHICSPLQRDWNKYGRESFIFEVLMHEDDSLARLRYERAWIIQQIAEGKSLYNQNEYVRKWAPRLYSTLGTGFSEALRNFLSNGSWRQGDLTYSACAEILADVGIDIPDAHS